MAACSGKQAALPAHASGSRRKSTRSDELGACEYGQEQFRDPSPFPNATVPLHSHRIGRWDLTLAVNQESVAASAVLALVLNDHLVRLGELGGRGRRQRGVLERRESATVDAARAVLGDRLGLGLG